MIGFLAGAAAGAVAAALAWRRLRLRRAFAVMWQQLAWSWRVAPRDALVLDVGAGNNPHVRADVLCERFLADDVHRGGAVARDRPLIAADAAALPFKTGSIDLLIARALLEHLRDPRSFFAEAGRVAHGGLFVAPSAVWERCASLATHLWSIERVDGRLRFTAKPRPVLEPELQRFFTAEVLSDAACSDDFLLDHWDALRITYEWRGHPDCEVIGVPGSAEEGFLSESTAAPVQHRPSGSERLRAALKRWTRMALHAALSAHRDIDWNAILACPACGADVVVMPDAVHCTGCRRRYPMEQGVPIMLIDEATMIPEQATAGALPMRSGGSAPIWPKRSDLGL